VIPPLAFWANQRVLVSPTTKAVSIAQENENALDLPALHFKSRNEISSEEESGCEILVGMLISFLGKPVICFENWF